MTSVIHSKDDLRVVLVASSTTSGIAIPTIARHLKVPMTEAARLVGKAPTTLAERMTAASASRLVILLRAMGLQVRTEPAAEPTVAICERLLDVSIQPVAEDRLAALSSALLSQLPNGVLAGRSWDRDRVAAMLAGPGGIILEREGAAAINALKRCLRKVQGLRLAVSDPATALYDILPGRTVVSELPRSLQLYLRCLGLGPCRLTGAIAARVGSTTRDHVLQQFPDAGLIAFNQDFQRFDLFLTGACNVSPREVADFLATRSDLPRQMLERMPRPLRIETGLRRATALAFQTDYAALGLETEARLRLHYPIPCPDAERILP